MELTFNYLYYNNQGKCPKLFMVYQSLFQYIESKSCLALRDDEKLLIQATFKLKHLKKRQYLLQEGDICKYMAFVVNGAGRMYSVNATGQEHIVRFAIESWWLGDFESYNLQTPSRFNVEMTEDSDVLMVTHSQIQELIKAVPAVDLMIKVIDQKSAITTQKRIHSAISLSAEERYAELSKSYPEFLKRFPQGMIASYLGVSPETLSRIRKSLLFK